MHLVLHRLLTTVTTFKAEMRETSLGQKQLTVCMLFWCTSTIYGLGNSHLARCLRKPFIHSRLDHVLC